MKKKNQIIAGALITALAAGVAALLIWRKNSGRIVIESENEAQDRYEELPEKHRPNKHVTNVFHNAKAAINGKRSVPA